MIFQWSLFIFLNKDFHEFVLTKFSLSLFNTLSCPYMTTAILISKDSLTFLSQHLFFMERVLGCNQSKWSWHSFVCPVALEDDQLPLMLSCWCSIDLLMIFFFVSPLYTDPDEYFNLYTPRQLFGINLPLFLHKIFFKLGPV